MCLLQVGLPEPSPPKETYTNADTHTPITPIFSFGSSYEIVGIMFINRCWPIIFHIINYNLRCRRMLSKLAGVINPTHTQH